jgi:hypothetical protein
MPVSPIPESSPTVSDRDFRIWSFGSVPCQFPPARQNLSISYVDKYHIVKLLKIVSLLIAAIATSFEQHVQVSLRLSLTWGRLSQRCWFNLQIPKYENNNNNCTWIPRFIVSQLIRAIIWWELYNVASSPERIHRL